LPGYREISLDEKASISAHVAITQHWFHATPELIRTAWDKMSDLDKEIIQKANIRENLIVPVIDNGGTIGLFHLTAIEQPVNLDANSIQHIVAFVENMVPHIRAAQRMDDLERLKQEQEQSIDLLRSISILVELEDVADLFLDEILKLSWVDSFVLSLLDDRKEKFFSIKSVTNREDAFSDAAYKKVKYPFEKEKLENFCFTTRQPQKVSLSKGQRSHFSENFVLLLEKWKEASVVIMPLFFGHEPSGHLIVASDSVELSAEHLSQLSELIHLFQVPLANTRQFSLLKSKEAQVNRSEQERTRFLEFISRVNRLTSLEEIYGLISREFLKWFPFDISGVYMKEGDALLLKTTAVIDHRYETVRQQVETYWLEHPYSIQAMDGVPVMALKNDAYIHVEDASQVNQDEMTEKDRGSLSCYGNVRTVLHIPIKQWDVPIGILSLWSLDVPSHVLDEDIRFLRLVCAHIGNAIMNASLYSTVDNQRREIENALSELNKTQEKLVVTERKRADALRIAKETAENSARAKGEFLANMSHEIRTPLNAVIGLSSLALKTVEDPRQRDYLVKIDQSSKTLLGIINDILDFSKIEAGKLELESAEFDLEYVMENLTDLFFTKAAEKELEMIVAGLGSVPRRLVGDALRLGQILINLTNNALKFTDRGHILVRVSPLEISPDKVELQFSVEDTGIGIAPENLSKLFRSFSQADSSTTRKYGGTGLGLSISKHLVNMMGGKIWAESEYGQGSRFVFTCHFGMKAATNEYQANDVERLAGKRVLVVDDSPAVTTFLSEELTALECSVEPFNAPQELFERLETAETCQWDMAIVDAMMPSIEGVEIIDRLVKDSRFASAHFVLMTRYDDPSINELINTGKASAILIKPLKHSLLRQTVCQLFLGKDLLPDSYLKEGGVLADKYLENLRGSRWLLVEDNDINQQVAVELLQEVGIDVSVADNGVSALALMADHVFDGVLTDIQMPEMDGYELTSALRMRYPDKNLPIIAMTAHALTGYKEKCLSAGMNDYVTKPIDQRALYETLAKYCDRRRVTNMSEKIEPPSVDKCATRTQENTALPSKDFVLPDTLPGFELEAAVKRLGGKTKILSDILMSFEQRYQNAGRQLTDLLNAGRTEEGVRLVHTIKGLAGTVGAEKVKTRASELEQILKVCAEQGQVSHPQLTEAIAGFEEVLGEALGAIEQARGAQSAATAENQPHEDRCHKALSETDKREVSEWLKEMNVLLEHNNFEAVDVLEKLTRKLVHQGCDTLLQELSAAMDEFDFACAQMLLQQLENTLERNPAR
jgi:signal transduction histidine kinase/CheY-like chemotaxis protein